MADKHTEITAIGSKPKKKGGSSSVGGANALRDRLKELRAEKDATADKKSVLKPPIVLKKFKTPSPPASAGKPLPPPPGLPKAPPLPGTKRVSATRPPPRPIPKAELKSQLKESARADEVEEETEAADEIESESEVVGAEDTSETPTPDEGTSAEVEGLEVAPEVDGPEAMILEVYVIEEGEEAGEDDSEETAEAEVAETPEPDDAVKDEPDVDDDENDSASDLRLDISSLKFSAPSEVSQLIEARRSASQLIPIKPNPIALNTRGVEDDDDDDDGLTGRERRRARRSITDLFVFVHEGDRSHLCQAIDLSRSGIRLQPPDTTFEPGEMVRLSFDIDSYEIQTTARLAAIHPDGSLGLQMLALSRLDIKHIGVYVDAAPDAEEDEPEPAPLDRDSKFVAEANTASGLLAIGPMLTALKEREAEAEAEVEQIKSGLWVLPKQEEIEEAEREAANDNAEDRGPAELAAGMYGEAETPDRRNIAIYVLCGVVALLAGLLIFSREEPAAKANASAATPSTQPAEPATAAPSIVDTRRLSTASAINLARRDIHWSAVHANTLANQPATPADTAEPAAPASRTVILDTIPKDFVVMKGDDIVCEKAPCEVELIGDDTLTFEPAPKKKKKSRRKRKKKKSSADPFSVKTD